MHQITAQSQSQKTFETFAIQYQNSSEPRKRAIANRLESSSKTPRDARQWQTPAARREKKKKEQSNTSR